jgi:putative tricarboxylic transport membrane protein
MVTEVIIALLQPSMIAIVIGGVFIGNLVGCLPGLTATMALAVLLPVTYYMPISTALVLMGSIYVGAIRGGGITAILLNVPGTPSDIATTFDGFPLAQKGLARRALMMSIFASIMGGIIGNTFLAFLAPPLARISLRLGPSEFFWLCILGITIMVSITGESLWKGLISGFIGLLVTTVGVSPLGGETRFTFGLPQLAGGVPIIVGLIGLYCIPRVFELAQERVQEAEKIVVKGSIHSEMAWVIRKWFSGFQGILSSLIGTFIGVLPGAGGNIAGIMAYDQVKRMDKHPEEFGKGRIEGVLAAETANNAVVSSSLIPAFTFGIPGSPPAAIMLGAILVQGLRPGAKLFTEHALDMYILIGGFFFANLALFLVMYMSPIYSKILSVPREILAVFIAVMSVVGTFAIRGNFADVMVMCILGIAMYFGRQLGFPTAPAVLGIVLGRLAEEGLTQSMMIAKARGGLLAYFFGRPITVLLMVLILFFLAWPFLQARWGKRRVRDEED